MATPARLLILKNELAFANAVRKPLVCEPRLASPTQFADLWFANRDWLRQRSSQTFGLRTEIASLP